MRFSSAALAVGVLLAGLTGTAHADPAKISGSTTIGVHNTYDTAAYDYLARSLDNGTSMIELDVWPNIITKEWKVSHSNPLGNGNNCVATTSASQLYTGGKNKNLEYCLDDIRIWLDAHPGKGPILLKLEMKTGFSDNGGRSPDELDASIRGHLGGHLFRPADLLGGYATLDEAAKADNWLTQSSLQGKVFIEIIPGTVEEGNPTDTLKTDVEYARYLVGLKNAGRLGDAQVFPTVHGAVCGDPRDKYEAALEALVRLLRRRRERVARQHRPVVVRRQSLLRGDDPRAQCCAGYRLTQSDTGAGHPASQRPRQGACLGDHVGLGGPDHCAAFGGSTRLADGQHELSVPVTRPPSPSSCALPASSSGNVCSTWTLSCPFSMSPTRSAWPAWSGSTSTRPDPDAAFGGLRTDDADHDAAAAHAGQPAQVTLLADHAEHHVQVGRRRRRIAVVDGLVDADRAQELVLRRAGRAEDVSAARLRDLHGQVADAARRAVDENTLSRPDVRDADQRLPRGQPGERESGGFDVGEALGLADEVSRWGDHVVRVCGGLPREQGQAEYLVADVDLGRAETELLDDARDVPAQRVGRLAHEDLVRPRLPVDRVDPGRVHPHKHLGRAGWRPVGLDHTQHFGSAELLLGHRSHRLLLSVFAVMTHARAGRHFSLKGTSL